MKCDEEAFSPDHALGFRVYRHRGVAGGRALSRLARQPFSSGSFDWEA